MKKPTVTTTPGGANPGKETLAESLNLTGSNRSVARDYTSGITRVELLGATTASSSRAALWTAIRAGSQAINFKAYSDFIHRVLAPDKTHTTTANDEKALAARKYSHLGTDAYSLLRDATRAFVALNAGSTWTAAEMGANSDTQLPFARPRVAGTGQPVSATEAIAGEADRRDVSTTYSYQDLVLELQELLPGSTRTTPYLEQIATAIIDTAGNQVIANSFGMGVVRQRLQEPCLIELIWSFYIEEAAVVQSINAIALRFQNRRGPGERDPLAHLKFDTLRPMANLLWGYIQDEINRLTLPRRVYEYAHEYGLTLLGRAVPTIQAADTRSKFLEAFNNLLHSATRFFKEADDKTVVPDGFPLLNALKEVHLLLAQGCHNQIGDLPFTARVEMLIQQWLLARPEVREYLGAAPAMPYPEEWMGTVDTLKSLQGWSDVSVMHFRDLAILGEQLVLSIRHEDWSDTTQRTSNDAASWALYWRSDIQAYIHAYRAVTSVDLSTEVSDTRSVADRYTQPAVLHRRRLELSRSQRNGSLYTGRRLTTV